jgi:hypothetical protein
MSDTEARATPELRVVESEHPPAPTSAPNPVAPPVTQALIDAVTQLEANKKDVSPRGFQKRLQLAYAIYDQASLMMQEIEAQHARLVSDLLSVDRRTPLSAPSLAAAIAAPEAPDDSAA